MKTIYFLYGILLVIVFVAVIIYYFHPKHKNNVESPKYRMLDDDDH